MNLHCIGDSHTSFFTGYNMIQSEYPEVGKSIAKKVFTYRIGAPLAYNLCELVSKERSNEKLYKIIEELSPANDYILLCFGEIDCRAHIIKQAEIKGKEISEIVNECVDRYLKVILDIKAKGFNVGVWNAIPTAIGIENPDSEFPYYGDFKKRNTAAFLFNERLKKYSEQFVFGYFGIFEKLVDGNLVSNELYYFDKIHLNSKALPSVLKSLQKKIDGFYVKKLELFNIRIRYLLYLSRSYRVGVRKTFKTILTCLF